MRTHKRLIRKLFGTLLLLALVGLQPVPMLAANLELRDSTGKFVGDIFGGVPEQLTLTVTIPDGRTVALRAHRNRITGSTPVFYQSNDSTGPAFMGDGIKNFLFPAAAVARPGKTLYVEDQGSVLQNVLTQSGSSTEFDGSTSCFPEPPFLRSVVPASSVLDIGAEFTPPFSLKGKPK